jgi:hypothetical protein
MAELKLGTTIGGSVAWHEGNDGSGSGLDADYLDGNHASAFALSGHTHSYLSAESDTLASVTGRGASTTTQIVLSGGGSAGGSDANGVYGLQVQGANSYACLELGVRNNYEAVIRSYGNDIHYFAGHWRSTATASEDHSHYWYTAKNGSTNWNTAKMRLDHNGMLTVSGAGVFNGITINQERENNARIYSNTTGAMGLLGVNSDGSYRWQIYGDGTTYGFLDSTWGNWDIQKTVNGNMNLRVSNNNYQVYHTGNVPGWITGNQTITLSGDVSGSGATSISVTVNQIDGWGFANTGNNSAVNANTLEQNGITYYSSGVDNFSGNSTDGALYSQFYSSSWQHQIAGDYREGNIAVRGKNNGTWSRWKPVPTITISDSAPGNETRGDLWWESDTGKLKIWYADANTEQWVDAVPIPDTSTFFSKAGGSITGPVVTNSSLTVGGNTFSKKTNITSNGAGWDDHLNLYSSDATNRWNVLVDSGASNRLRFAYNGSEKFYVNTSGEGYVSSTFTSGANITSNGGLGVANTSSSTGTGLSLYGGGSTGMVTYGISFAGTGTFGTHGSVTSDWATYFNMNNDSTRGWIFKTSDTKNTTGNVASISGGGTAVFNGNVTAYSDIRVKTNIKIIDNAVEKVMQLDGITYDRTDTPELGRQTGVIAQQVLKVLPEAVLGSEDTTYSVAYGNMVGLLIEAMKEQQKQIEELKAEVKALKG